MNSSESEHDPAADALRRALKSLPVPETPSGLESQVRGRILRRRVQRTAVAASAAVVILLGLFAWQPWANDAVAPIPHQPGPVAQSTPEIQPDELDVLFAPPPVASLDLLARHDAVSVNALNRMEGVK